MTGAMTLWQPGVASPYAVPNGALNGYETTDMMSGWGVVRAPVVMLAPVRPMVLSPRRLPQSGSTGVFLENLKSQIVRRNLCLMWHTIYL